jgi:hypothetical protein
MIAYPPCRFVRREEEKETMATMTREHITEGIQAIQNTIKSSGELLGCGIILEIAQEYLDHSSTPRQESLKLQRKVDQAFKKALRQQKSHATYVTKAVEAILDAVVYYNAHLANPSLWDEEHALYYLQCAVDYLARSQQ